MRTFLAGCEYCGRQDQSPERKSCDGCGAPKPFVTAPQQTQRLVSSRSWPGCPEPVAQSWQRIVGFDGITAKGPTIYASVARKHEIQALLEEFAKR